MERPAYDHLQNTCAYLRYLMQASAGRAACPCPAQAPLERNACLQQQTPRVILTPRGRLTTQLVLV